MDRLTTGRLAFLGVALTAIPVGRRHAGDARPGRRRPLLAVGTLLLTPLVLIRVGRLARQRARAEAALHHQATHDLLTGLPNRAELLVRLDAELSREQAAGRPSVVLLFCDLNGFKQVNERYGHVAGDQLLTEVPPDPGRPARRRHPGPLQRRRVPAALRRHRPAGRRRPPDRARRAGARRAVPAAGRAGRGDRRVSVGVVLSTGTLAADELITRADQEMYAAKQRHRAALHDLRVG